MTDVLEQPRHNRHRVQHSMVLIGVLGVVAYGANEVSGGIDNVERIWADMHDSSLGLKNIQIDDTKTAADSSKIGMSAQNCLDPDIFSTDRVYKTESNPDSYLVTVRKIGAGTLDAASVSNCIFTQTGLQVTVEEEANRR